MTYPEHSLARRLTRDDPEALGQVLRWISAALTSPQFWSLRSEWPDLVQEVLARLIKALKAGRYDAERDFHAYVVGIVRHTALQALERAGRRREETGSGMDPDRERDRGVAASEGVSIKMLVRRVMDEASEDCRALMRAYYLEEKSYDAIAEEFSIPAGTVKSRLSRCLDCARRSFRVVVRRRPTRAQAGSGVTSNLREPQTRKSE